MAMLKCQCVQCYHKFYWVSVDCRLDDRVVCPLCQSPAEVDDIELPAGQKWAECVKHGCSGCANRKKSKSKKD